MDYLEYFGLTAEPFSHAPVARFYYASRQHTDALKRLMHAAHTMKGLAILVGDIGHGKTTLARRLLDALPPAQYEAAMLVIVHAGVTPHWLLRRIAAQLGVEDPPDDKLAVLSRLYDRLLEIHQSGKRTVVLIDEAQMLASRELMEEFRGLLNLEVPGHKLISFVFFGLPDIENNLQLDPALAQRVALRYHLKPLGVEETTAYVQHRLRLCGAKDELFSADALAAVHNQTHGVPRLINTLCDNVLLELFFCKLAVADAELVLGVAANLGFGAREKSPAAKGLFGEVLPSPVADREAVVATQVIAETESRASPGVDADAIAARVAGETLGEAQKPRFEGSASFGSSIDIEDPLSFLQGDKLSEPQEAATSVLAEPLTPMPERQVQPGVDDLCVSAAPALAQPEDSAAPQSLVLPYDPDVDVTAIKPRLVVPAPAIAADDASFEVVSDDNEPLPFVGPPPESPTRGVADFDVHEQPPSPAPTQLIQTSAGKINLNEIDDLLADIKTGAR